MQDDIYQSLGRILQTELTQTRELLNILQLETDALAEANPAALEDLLGTKQQQVRTLEATGTKREELLASISAASNSDAEALIKQHPQLSVIWNELLGVAEKCQNKNRLNGSVIELGYRKSQQAMNILRGANNRIDSYNNNGQTNQNPTSHKLATV